MGDATIQQARLIRDEFATGTALRVVVSQRKGWPTDEPASRVLPMITSLRYRLSQFTMSVGPALAFVMVPGQEELVIFIIA